MLVVDLNAEYLRRKVTASPTVIVGENNGPNGAEHVLLAPRAT